MLLNAAFHQGLHYFIICKRKIGLQTNKYIFFLNYNLTHLDVGNNGLSKFNVSNQKEESISIQTVDTYLRSQKSWWPICWIYAESLKLVPWGIPPEGSTSILKNLSGPSSECQSVWIQIMPDILSGLIWVQTVCKGYKQMTLWHKALIHTWEAKIADGQYVDSSKLVPWGIPLEDSTGTSRTSGPGRVEGGTGRVRRRWDLVDNRRRTFVRSYRESWSLVVPEPGQRASSLSKWPLILASKNSIKLFAWWVIFHSLAVVCWLFQNYIFFSKKIFQEHYQSVKRFVSRYVPIDLVPNCLQRLSADDKSCR